MPRDRAWRRLSGWHHFSSKSDRGRAARFRLQGFRKSYPKSSGTRAETIRTMPFKKSKKALRALASWGRQHLNALRLSWGGHVAQRSSKRFFLLDPALRDRLGHHQDAAKCLLAEATAMGLPCMILGNQEAEPDALGLPVWRHFRVAGYAISKEANRGKSNENRTLKQNQILFQDLCRLPTALFCRDDLLLFPAVTRNQILGICQWIAQLSDQGATSPRIAVCLMFPPDWLTSPTNTDAEAIYRQAIACIDPAAQVVWICETAALAEVFEPLIGCRPIVLPLVILPDRKGLAPAPTPAPAPAPAPATMEGHLLPAEPMVSVLGHTKAEKGSLMVPEVAERVVQMRPRARFTVQATSRSAQHEDALIEACQALRPAPTIVRGSVEQKSFVRLLHETDLMLLPYDAESYGPRGSGLAIQATALGIPLVAPAGCAFADTAAHEDRAVLFASHDPESIAMAVVTALDRLGALKENAAAIARAAATKPGYLETLLEL